MIDDQAATLDDGTVLRILSHLNVQLYEEVLVDERPSVKSAEEAGAAIVAFLEENGEPIEGIKAGALGDTLDANAARGVLDLVLEDERVRRIAEPLVAHPPDDDQRAVELAAEGAIIIAALVGFLQTKVEIDVNRKGGETEFHFALKKNAMDPAGLKEIAKKILELLLD